MSMQRPMVWPEAVFNVLLPVLIYTLAHQRWGDVPSLMASAAPPIIWSVTILIRDRRLDALSLIALVGILLSLIAFAGGGSPRFLQLREKTVTLLIGLAFLGSAAIGKPLIYPLARATAARKSAEDLAAFEANVEDAAFRRTVLVMTLVWGFGLLADVAVSVVLIFALTIPQYLVVGPALLYGTIGALTMWTVWYRRRRERKAYRGPEVSDSSTSGASGDASASAPFEAAQPAPAGGD